MERSAFFNSVAGDRKYKAEIFAGYFSKFITNGVFPLPADNLRIAAHDRMKIKATLVPAISTATYMKTPTSLF